MNIWILDSKKGITLLNKNFLDFPVKDDLVSGLLTALNQFTLTEFNQPIDSIDMGGFRWIYILEPEYNLLFVVADVKDSTAENLKARLMFIKQLFIKQYVQDKEHWKKTWNGDMEIFKPFGDLIDKYYSQWQVAENMNLIADCFDMIGVFQELLNMIKRVIDNQVDTRRKEKIVKETQKFVDNFKSRVDVQRVKELGKMTYDETMGFNIFNINPANCDVVMLKNQLKNFLIQIVKIIKDELGHDLSLNYFSDQKIFNYVFSNMPLLKRLQLEGFLLQLFLLF